jgi:predicted nucleic acid-binding protein
MRRIARRIKRVAAWWGTTVEAQSAFSRLVRDGKMTARGLKQAVARLEVQRAAWIEVLPSDRVREIAETLPEQYGLRALDSFQLAAALVWCKEQPRGRWFVCCDVRLADAATKTGFDVIP